jgi:hypothetical protein
MDKRSIQVAIITYFDNSFFKVRKQPCSEHFTTWTGIQGDSVADFNSSFILDYAVVAPQGTSIAHSM